MNLVVLSVILLCSSVLTQTEFDPTGSTTSATSNSVGDFLVSQVGDIWTSSGVNTVRLPKCCPFGYAVGVKNCTNSSVDLQPKFGVYIHNETAFNDVPLQPELVTFDIYVHQSCKGRKFPLSPDEDPKILLNGSLLLAGFGEYDGIKNHDEFCIDNLNDNTNTTDTTVYVFVCLKEQTEGYPQWVFSTYITLITVSAILFITSAGFFFRQDVQGIHKKSFIAYALSMSLTYFIVILMQFISGGCRGLGLLLQFFLILSFAWLAILCLDLAWMIHYYRVKDHMDRFMSYVGISVAYSTIFLIPSLLNNFTPDIPSSFFKPQFRRTTCSSFDETQHRGFFYFALIVSILTSVFSLLYFLIKMNQHGNENGNGKDVQWKKDSAKFRNMYGRLLILFITMFAWFLDSFSNRFADSSGISTLILIIQAFQGFIIVPLFTMKTLRKVIDINKKPRIENLQELIEFSKNNYDRTVS